jgi:hypothetical protein
LIFINEALWPGCHFVRKHIFAENA